MSEETLTDEQFWTEFRDLLFPEDKVDSAEEEVEKIIDLTGLEPGKILDMPCGVGRHSKELNEKDFKVVGVDKTSSYVKEARENFSGDIEFVNQDMKDFRRENEFNAVINWWNSFGYFEDKKDDQKMLENIFASLKEGGILAMDVWGKELAAKNGFGRRWSKNGEMYNMEKTRIKNNWKKSETTWIKIENGEKVEYVWEQRLYAASELEKALNDAGFSKVEFYGNLEGDDYDEDADRMIVVAEK